MCELNIWFDIIVTSYCNDNNKLYPRYISIPFVINTPHPLSPWTCVTARISYWNITRQYNRYLHVLYLRKCYSHNTVPRIMCWYTWYIENISHNETILRSCTVKLFLEIPSGSTIIDGLRGVLNLEALNQ